MTTKAVIRIAEIVTQDVMLAYEQITPGRQLVQRGALTLERDAAVLVNHDPGDVVGRVVELFEWDLWDGLWLVARCELHRVPAGWRKGHGRATRTPVSTNRRWGTGAA